MFEAPAWEGSLYKRWLQSEQCGYFWVGLVRARKTRSSMGMVRVKSGGAAPLDKATAWAELERAGPAGLVCRELASPGTSEIRVVTGVQAVVAPKQVSRTKTWR